MSRAGLKRGCSRFAEPPQRAGRLRRRQPFVVEALGAEGTMVLRRRLELSVSGSYSREDRVERRDLRQYSLSTGLGFRF